MDEMNMPEGWPTEEMRIAGWRAYQKAMGGFEPTGLDAIEACFKAMITAAPTPPAGKIMPPEMTDEMEKVAVGAMWNAVPVWDRENCPHPNDVGRVNLAWCEPDEMLKAAYKAMYAITPTPPAQEVQWKDAERVSDMPEVHEALMDFAEDHTGDNGTYIVKAVMQAIKTPAQEAEPVLVGHGINMETCTLKLGEHEYYYDVCGATDPEWEAMLKLYNAPSDKLRQAAGDVVEAFNKHVAHSPISYGLVKAISELDATLEGK